MSKLKTKFQTCLPCLAGRQAARQVSNLTRFFLFLTIFFAPLYVVRFRIWEYPSTLLEVLIGLAVVSWVAEKARQGRAATKPLFQSAINNQQLAILLFLLAAAISVIVSPDKRGALGIFKAYFVEPLLIYFVIKDVVKSKRDWELIFLALALSGLWVALLAVFQGLTGRLVFTLHEAALGRAHAVYDTANAVGLYLGPIIMLLLGVGGNKLKTQNPARHASQGEAGRSNVKTKSQILKLRWLILFAIFVMVLAVILSRSSGAMVGLVAGLGFLGVRRGIGFVRVVGVVGAILGIWFFFNISNFTPKNVDPYVRKSTDTLQFRLCLWEGTRNLLWDRPIFGAGLSGFKELYSQQYFTCDAEPLEYPHNWVLNFWSETGALGLIAFLWILWRYYKSVNESVSQCVKGAFLAAMVYWLVHGLVDVPYFKNDLSLEFWVLVGLAETLGLAL